MKNLGGKVNMAKMMKQIEKAQADLARVQDEVGQREVTASSGGEMVTVTLTGNLDILDIEIKPEVVDPDDIEMLQDLVIAAVSEGIKKARDMMNSEMAKLKLPGLP